MRNLLTNVLGGPDSGFTVEVNRHRLADGDRVLLCTDGLTDLVADDEIARVLEQNPAPADVCRVLIDLCSNAAARTTSPSWSPATRSATTRRRSIAPEAGARWGPEGPTSRGGGPGDAR